MTLQLTGLLDSVRGSGAYRSLVESLRSGDCAGSHVLRAARPCLLAALAADWDGPIIFLTATARRAYDVSEQLPIWLADSSRLHRFAEPSAQFYDRSAWDAGVIRGRIAALDALARARTGKHPIIVASARAVMQATLPPDRFRDSTMTLRVGQRHRMDALISRWLGMGYESETIVHEPGTFSRRGGILDIFPLASEFPVRVDFFDDEIESLRRFDPGDQRSKGKLLSARIVPAREALPGDAAAVGENLREWADTLADDEGDFSGVSMDIDSLSHGSAFPGLEHYLPHIYDMPSCLLDHAPDNCLVLLDDSDHLQQACARLADDAEVNRHDALDSLQIAPRHPAPYLSWDALQARIDNMPSANLGASAGESPRIFAPGERFGGQLRYDADATARLPTRWRAHHRTHRAGRTPDKPVGGAGRDQFRPHCDPR